MRRVLFFISLVIAVLSISCQDENPGTDPGNSSQNNSFNLSYHISSLTSPSTKSQIPVEEGEDVLNSFYILFFEHSTGGTGLFLEAVEIDASNLTSSEVINIPFPENSSLTNSEDYRLILCANIEDYTGLEGLNDLKEYCQGLEEREVAHTLLRISGVDPSGMTVASEQADNSNRMPMNNLPMSASVEKKANETMVSAELIRTVCRLDVTCEANGYELVSASVWNGFTTTPLIESVFNDFTDERTQRYYGVEATNNQILGSLYAFENYVARPEQNDKKSTCLIIGLRRTGSTRVEYFRNNVNVSQINGQTLKRNTVYRLTIKGVSSDGADTEREAYEGKDHLIYYLEVNPTTLSRVPAAGGSTEEITVQTNGNWTARITRYGFYGQAGFDRDTRLQEINGAGRGAFVVTFAPLKTGSVYPRMDITISVDGTDISETLQVHQEPESEGLIVWGNAVAIGNLTTPTSPTYSNYVYNLGENMRNTDLFGPNGFIEIPGGYKFVGNQLFGDDMLFGQASLIQILSAPEIRAYENIKQVMELYENKLLMFTSQVTTSSYLLDMIEKYNQVFGESGYVAESANHPAAIDRYMHPNVTHPLIDYLLEKGPFTDSRNDRENILLKSRGGTTAGLKTWPETFVPIIMSTESDNTYCVFGIDPTTRLMFLTDPAIFGAKSGTNGINYTAEKTENTGFLNNLIAWISYVTLPGSTFLDEFKVKPVY